jgi:hypothetical protein
MAGTTYRMHAKPAQLAAIGTTFTLFKTSADATVPVKVYMPGSSRLKGKTFRVHASGRATTAGAYTVKATLQFGTSGTTGSNTTIEATSAVSVSTTSTVWRIEAVLNVDDVLKTLRGSGSGMVQGTVDAIAAIDNAPTSVNPATEGQGFVVGITFGTDAATNTADLDSFYLEVLD